MFRHTSAIALFILLTLTAPLRAADFFEHFIAVNPPQSLPSFLFQDPKGETHNLADFRGHAILLNLWATWCGPCVQEMPSLDALQGKMGSNLTIIALDQERNSAEATESYYKRHEMKYLQLYSDPSGRAASILHARGLPVSYLINREGNEIGYIEGGVDWSSPEVVEFIRTHLISGKP